MITNNIFFHLIFYLMISLVPIGYGQFLKNIILKRNNEKTQISFIGFLGFFFLYFISIIFHLTLGINKYLIYLVLLIGLILFLYFFFKKKFEKNNLYILIILLFLFYSLSLISEPNEDFFFYYLPYLNYLMSSNIIIGLVNINDILAFSTNSLFDIYIFFQIPYFIDKGYSIPSVIFYVFFLLFFIELLKKDKKNILILFILILSITSFNKLRDFGTAIPPQFLLIIATFLIYDAYKNVLDFDKISRIIFFISFAIILRFNSIIILPLISIFLILNYKNLFKYLKNNKIFLIFINIVLVLFFIKNILISGCLVYPAYQTCFKNLNWGADHRVVELKYNKLKADSMGWPFYAKEEFDINEKFVWDYRTKKNFKPYDEYAKSFPFFWYKYWIKDNNYKKIINLLLLTLVLFFSTIFINLKNKNFIKNNNNNNNNNYTFLLSLIISLFLWFIISPQIRYGGYFIFIILFSFISTFIIIKKFLIKNFFPLYFLLFISFSYVQIKNVNRIYTQIQNDNFIFFPWPNYPNMIENTDYIKINDPIIFNQRIKSNKLIFDNDINYILMCGNIPFPCIPKGKEICMENLRLNKNYKIIKKNNSVDKCYNFMIKNILY